MVLLMNKKIEKFVLENIDKTVRYSPEDEGTLIGLPYKYTVPCVERYRNIRDIAGRRPYNVCGKTPLRN